MRVLTLDVTQKDPINPPGENKSGENNNNSGKSKGSPDGKLNKNIESTASTDKSAGGKDEDDRNQ